MLFKRSQNKLIKKCSSNYYDYSQIVNPLHRIQEKKYTLLLLERYQQTRSSLSTIGCRKKITKYPVHAKRGVVAAF